MKVFFVVIGTVVVLALATIFILPASNGNVSSNDSNIIATSGIHWHPQLTMYVKGEKIEIPQNIGIGAVHQPMHTHDDLPIIHLEFPALVRKQDITLKRFFEIWGKGMQSFGVNMTMTVNGEPNTKFGDYVIHDGDKIELRYE